MRVENLSRSQVLGNSLWKFLESAGVHILQLVITILLARLLTPDDYGLMAIVLVVITFLGLFVNSGISSYLVYMKDVRKPDFLTLLLFNVFVSLFLVLFLFAFADVIATYYSAPSLSPLIKAMSITLPFSAVSSVYNAYAMKMSLFKTLFLRNIIALPVSGILALVLAFSGWGVWSLVIYQMCYMILLSIIIVFTIKIDIEGEWKLDLRIISPMLKFGGFTMLSSIIAFVSDSISDLLIGKRINTTQLGYYNRGFTFPSVFMSVVNEVLAGTLFPAFASYTSNMFSLKDKCRKTLRILNFAIFPLLFGLIGCAKPLVMALLSVKWEGAIPVVQTYCLFFCFIPILQTMSQVYLALGFVKLRTFGEVLKMILTITALFFLIDYGIIAVVLARTLVNFLLFIYTIIISKWKMNYSFYEVLKDTAKPLFLSLILLCCIYPIIYIPVPHVFILIIQIAVGITIYVLTAKIFKVKELDEIVAMVYSRIKK